MVRGTLRKWAHPVRGQNSLVRLNKEGLCRAVGNGLSTFNLEHLDEEYLYQDAIRTIVAQTDQLETETG